MLPELKAIFPLLRQSITFSKIIFFPSAFIEWNNLDPNLRNSKSISVFKEKILNSYNLPQIMFLILAILKESNLSQDLDLV